MGYKQRILSVFVVLVYICIIFIKVYIKKGADKMFDKIKKGLQFSTDFYGVLSVIGGIVSIIWLIILGKWKLVIVGLAIVFFVRFVISFLNLISSMVAMPGVKLIMKNYAIIGSFICFISIFISLAISYIWAVIVTDQVLTLAQGNIIPYSLFAFFIITLPFLLMQYSASPTSKIYIASVLIGSVFLYVGILMYGFTDRTFDIGVRLMAFIFFLGAILAVYNINVECTYEKKDL